MKKLVLVICFLGILIKLNAKESTPFQIWNTSSLSVKLAKKTELGISEKIHYSPTDDGLVMKYGQFVITQKLNSWLSISTGLRLSASKEQGIWVNEQRPLIYATLKKVFKDFEFVFSNRVEYRIFKDKPNQFRDIQKLDISSPSITKLGVGIYVSEEAFYVPKSNSVDILRFYSGFYFLNKKKVNLRLFYAIQLNKDLNSWAKTKVAGFSVNIRI